MSPKVSQKYKDEKRKEIIEAAKRVFRQKGYDLASVDEIVEEVKMSKGGVYHYFSGKEAIFEAILAERAGNFDLFEFKEGMSVWTVIKGALSQIRVDLKETRESFMPVVFEYFMRSYRDTAREKALRMQYEEGLQVWNAVIERGTMEGEFRPLLPTKSIARTIISFVDGMTCDAMQMDSDQLDIDSQMEAIIFYLRNALQIKEEELT
ncbi:TetR/AcrR family transcriptional regulator [Paenibacillus foliorum]|nr:TetR family transcriptional regulator [Paenibacillus foliorum]